MDFFPSFQHSSGYVGTRAGIFPRGEGFGDRIGETPFS